MYAPGEREAEDERPKTANMPRKSSEDGENWDVDDEDEAIYEDEEQAAARKSATKAEVNALMIRKLLINTALICAWFSLSMTLSLYNKWMFSSHDNKNGSKNLNFPFPLFTTSFHMLVQFFGAVFVLYVLPALRPPKDHHLSVKDYATRIGPCGIATGLDIGLSNASLKTITLAFYTMCKSSSLAFVLLFAFLFRIESPTTSLIGIIGIITIGVILMVATETRFVLEGFLLVVTATAMGGLRWALTQILLKQNPSTSNPFSSIYHLAPIMFAALIILAMLFEGPMNFLNAELWSQKGILSIPILIFPGILAFLMTASEFGLIKRTSVITLSVAGILKEVLTIALGAIVHGDELTALNLSGLFITFIGIVVYNYLKLRKMRKNVKAAVAEQHANEQVTQPLVSASH